jgi:FAD/FMN-containing dehydrogenase
MVAPHTGRGYRWTISIAIHFIATAPGERTVPAALVLPSSNGRPGTMMNDPILLQQPASSPALLAALRARLHCDVIDRLHPTYDEARRVWNGMIDRHPAVIVRCETAADVAETVRIAAEHRPLVSIRGGGHQVAGSAVCDQGLVIDLSAMKGVEVDPARRVARAQGGVTWGELDRATQPFGLATPGGEVSTTGIAGFTLGGGMGLLMRAHGLACDNVRSVEIVTADGVTRRASRTEHPDLYWAVRGGGRGVGVVTTFEFELHRVGPDVAVAQVFYAYDEAEQVLRRWQDLAPRMPETVTPQLILWSVPPDPSIPEELHGVSTVIVLGLFAGAAEQGAAVLQPLRELGTPLLDASGTMPYVDVQASVDALFPAGGRYYMKSHFMNELSDAAIAELLEHDARRPTPESLTVIRTLGGAVSRIAADDSAYPHRSSVFNVSVDAGWTDAALDDTAIGWARSAWDALQPCAAGGVYVNFAGLGEEASLMQDAVFGGSGSRLAAVRARYDPAGLFAVAARQP